MNAAIANTWGLKVKPGTTPPELHAIDVSGGWWIVDPLTGQPQIVPPWPSYVLETNLYGIHGMSWGGAGASSFALNSGGANDTFWSVGNPNAPVGSSRTILTTPYIRDITGVWLHQLFPAAINWNDFWLFGKGGHAAPDGAGWRVAWWSNGFPNLVQQMHYSLQGTPSPTALWSSTGTGTGSTPPGPTVIGGSWPQSGVSLRSNIRGGEVADLQTVRVAKVVPGTATAQTLVFGSGGRVIVLDGTTGHILGQSEDLGWGGMAMEVFDFENDGVAEVVCAPALAPIDAELPPQQPGQPQQHSGWMRSYVHVLRWDSASSRLVRTSTVPIGDPYATHDLHGYGACGVALADLTQDGKAEVLVTTLNGEFVVFDQTGGVINPAPLFRTIVEGQLGAFSSIVVGDLDQQFFGTKPELYIASSTGIRKFYVQ